MFGDPSRVPTPSPVQSQRSTPLPLHLKGPRVLGERGCLPGSDPREEPEDEGTTKKQRILVVFRSVPPSLDSQVFASIKVATGVDGAGDVTPRLWNEGKGQFWVSPGVLGGQRCGTSVCWGRDAI